MKLEKIKIVNFRSIKELELDFYSNSRVLVGINEAGKSNILKAAALLSDDAKIQNDDIRQESYVDERVTESYVEFLFTFSNEQLGLLKKLLLEKTLMSGDNPEILIHDNDILTYSDLCKLKGCCSYKVDVLKKEAEAKFLAFNSAHEYKVCSNLKTISNICPPDFEFELYGETYRLSEYSLIDINGLEGTIIPEEYL